jgi:hypothetical protein
MEEVWILGMGVAAKGFREKGEKFESKRENNLCLLIKVPYLMLLLFN